MVECELGGIDIESGINKKNIGTISEAKIELYKSYGARDYKRTLELLNFLLNEENLSSIYEKELKIFEEIKKDVEKIINKH